MLVILIRGASRNCGMRLTGKADFRKLRRSIMLSSSSD
jgi:hypothetical protein